MGQPALGQPRDTMPAVNTWEISTGEGEELLKPRDGIGRALGAPQQRGGSATGTVGPERLILGQLVSEGSFPAWIFRALLKKAGLWRQLG